MWRGHLQLFLYFMEGPETDRKAALNLNRLHKKSKAFLSSWTKKQFTVNQAQASDRTLFIVIFAFPWGGAFIY